MLKVGTKVKVVKYDENDENYHHLIHKEGVVVGLNDCFIRVDLGDGYCGSHFVDRPGWLFVERELEVL